ncbi:DUF3530 family protein [Arsukibacterium sp.]|uniref:DUF3530 family protein n=1 Tax=Arsukibacterium sp. TaxID=1977258 RepID=UPI002FD983A5
MRFLCFIVALSWALEASSTNLDPQQSWYQDLQRQTEPGELIELDALDGRFAALQRRYLSRQFKGTAILVPAAGHHAANDRQVNFLRHALTLQGWNTLAILPPNTDDDGLTATAILQQRLAAATSMAASEGGVIIVIAKGDNAAQLNQLYLEQQLPAPAALVLLGAYQQNAQSGLALAHSLASQTFPLLDIIQPQDHPLAKHQLELRRQLSAQQQKAPYRQRLLAGTDYSTDRQYWLANEIRGWLSTLAL